MEGLQILSLMQFVASFDHMLAVQQIDRFQLQHTDVVGY
jgi:hypothetical protein